MCLIFRKYWGLFVRIIVRILWKNFAQIVLKTCHILLSQNRNSIIIFLNLLTVTLKRLQNVIQNRNVKSLTLFYEFSYVKQNYNVQITLNLHSSNSYKSPHVFENLKPGCDTDIYTTLFFVHSNGVTKYNKIFMYIV